MNSWGSFEFRLLDKKWTKKRIGLYFCEIIEFLNYGFCKKLLQYKWTSWTLFFLTFWPVCCVKCSTRQRIICTKITSYKIPILVLKLLSDTNNRIIVTNWLHICNLRTQIFFACPTMGHSNTTWTIFCPTLASYPFKWTIVDILHTCYLPFVYVTKHSFYWPPIYSDNSIKNTLLRPNQQYKASIAEIA